MSRRKQVNPQQMQENKAVCISTSGADYSAKSNNLAEESNTDEKNADFVKSHQNNRDSETLELAEVSIMVKLSSGENLSPQSKAVVEQKEDKSKEGTSEEDNRTEKPTDLQDSSFDSPNDQMSQAIRQSDDNSPQDDLSNASLQNGELQQNEGANDSNFDIGQHDNDEDFNDSLPSSDSSDALDDSGKLCIAEDDDADPTVDFEEKQLSDCEDTKENSRPSPLPYLQKQDDVTATSSLSDCENEKPDKIMDEEVDDSKSKSIETELEQLRSQVGVIQQQNTVHMQMIHYLVTQINYLRNQRNFVGGNSPPPNGVQLNPFFHLMSSYNATGFADQGAVNGAPYGSPYNVLNGFSNGAAQVSRKAMLNETVKLENEAEIKAQEHKVYGDRLHPIIDIDKRYQSNANAALTAHVSKPHDPIAVVRDDLLRSSSSTPTNAALRSSPPDLQLEKPLKNQCRTCGKVLSCGSALKLHYRTHTGERPYSCDMCPRAFTTRGNLRTHYSSVHHRELPPANSFVKRNNGATRASEKLSCPVCSCACESNDVLTQHMQLHITRDHNLLALQQCVQQSALRMPPALASGKNILNGHDMTPSYRNSIGNGQAMFANKNDDLRKEEMNSSATNLSIRKQEVARSSLTDDGANKALDLSAGASNKHLTPRNDNLAIEDEKSMPFYESEENNGDRAEKENFMRRNATNFNAFAQFSKAAANGVQALDSHHPRYHACRVCIRRFQSEEELNEHLLSHDNLDESFSTLKQVSENRTSLKRSIEQELANVQDVKRLRSWCEICKKQFSSASSLAIHMRTHTGEKPYTCTVCHRAFTTRGNMKVHMNVHEYGVGGTRRGRRLSGTKKPQNIDMIADVQARFSEASAAGGFEPNETTLALLQRYAALARRMANGNQSNAADTNVQPAWGGSITAAQAIQQQHQQYLRSLALAADSPAAGSESTGGRPHNDPSSPEDQAEQGSKASGGEAESEVDASSTAPDAANKDWLLQMFQKTQGQVN